ncbi:aminopeptidase [Stenotrophobium rhamnosiphilum]|uniref:Aminopeptidase n=1 Tax=Stenotrophobium rhamnosiphilum TaxID=2029166 RepID=A0A2T5MI10_9GAMM|nr:aminopeptidase [Stenotrophobium rhamnosiphilum]PTU32208.1 aminopeptidase [Stenotrophobium rhamnosiphilum]
MRFPLSSILRAALLLTVLPLCACSNLAYYTRLAQGQHELMSARVPIRDIVKDEKQDPALRERLSKVLDARAFATQHLGLPDNDSYTEYADLKRPYVVWNVFATPELSLKPIEHCFLFVGCLAYRGYFDQQQAQEKSDELKAQDNDVYVSGVPAYSTLGWFDDPVINTMMNWSDAVLISTVFHELAHQQLYIKDDTVFNESFANFVGEEGLRQYLALHGGDSAADKLRRQRERQFTELVLASRRRLQMLYESNAPADAKRSGKATEFVRLNSEYQGLREGAWKDYSGYDRWFSKELNNARLLPFGLYDEYVPAFATLFRQSEENWTAFYAAAKALSKLPTKERKARLTELQNTEYKQP